MHVNSFSKFQMALPNHIPSPEDEKSFSAPMAVGELTCMSAGASPEAQELKIRFDELFESFRLKKPIASNEERSILKMSRPLLIEAHGSSFASEQQDHLKKRSDVSPKYFSPAHVPAKWIDLKRFHYWSEDKQKEEEFFQNVSFVGEPDQILFINKTNEVQALSSLAPVSLRNHTTDQKAYFPNHYLSEDYVFGYEDHTLGRVSRIFNLSYYRHIIPRSSNGVTSEGRDTLVRHMKFLKTMEDHMLWKEAIAGQNSAQSDTICDILFIEAGTTSLQDVLLALFILRIQYTDIRVSCCRGFEAKHTLWEWFRTFLERYDLVKHPGVVDADKLEERRRENPIYAKEVRLKMLGYERFLKSAQNRCKTIKRRKNATPSDLESAEKSLQQLRMQYIVAEQNCSKLEQRNVSKLFLDAIEAGIKYLEGQKKRLEKFDEYNLTYLKDLQSIYFL